MLATDFFNTIGPILTFVRLLQMTDFGKGTESSNFSFSNHT
jgi:hypothetical protein